MRRLLVLFTLAAATLCFATFGAVACGGNDHPPLTPDTLEPPAEAPDAGTSAPSTPPAK